MNNGVAQSENFLEGENEVRLYAYFKKSVLVAYRGLLFPFFQLELLPTLGDNCFDPAREGETGFADLFAGHVAYRLWEGDPELAQRCGGAG